MTVYAPEQPRATPGKTHLYDVDGDAETFKPSAATPPLCGMARSFGPFEAVSTDELEELADRPDMCSVCARRAAELLAE